MAANPEAESGSLDQKISTKFSRNLNLLHITMMGVGMMIGAGVFLGVGNAIRVSGPGGHSDFRPEWDKLPYAQPCLTLN
jgi:amino acid permease